MKRHSLKSAFRSKESEWYATSNIYPRRKPLTLGAVIVNYEQLIEEFAEAQKDVYRASPGEIVSHYERERTVINAYRGRQFLELIQNADDAAKDYSGKPALLIRLTDDHLIVANFGNPFTREGIESLVISDHSPKRLRRTRFIGNKGLGFRSILSWSKSPLVVSGELMVAFSPDYAKSQALSLADEVPRLKSKLEDWKAAGEALPIPVLRFPYVPPPRDARIAIAHEVMREGYDTVIVLPLSEESHPQRAQREIREQLVAISGKTLLFCYNLRGITIEAESVRAWTIERTPKDGGMCAIRIVAPDGESQWRLHRRIGALPQDLISAEIRSTPEYEVAAAVCNDAINRREQFLNVFFPTECRLPIEMCVHASLETDNCRKHLVEHAANEFVLSALADLIADLAQSETSPASPNRGLALIAGLEECDSELVGLGFRRSLVSACKSRKLIVCNDGEPRTPFEAKSPSNSVWHQFSHFPEFAAAIPSDLSSEDCRTLLKSLDVGWWSAEILNTKISSCLNRCTPDVAGRLLRQLIDSGQLPSPPPAVLRTSDSGVAPTYQLAFLPSDAPPVPLPTWAAKFFFLDKEFVKGLEAGSGATRARNLRDLLRQAGYKADEYGTEAIARHLIEAADEQIATEPTRATPVTRDVLRCLYRLLNSAESFVSLRTPCNVVTTKGNSRPATGCYLGPAYPQGALVSALYTPLGADELVGSPESLGLDGVATPRDIGRFLLQIGVAEEPRERFHGDGLESFADHVLDRLSYPNKLFRFEAHSADEARKHLFARRVSGLKLPDRFAQVLSKAPPEAVVAYLQSSGNRFIRTEFVDSARFEAIQSGERKPWPYFSVPIPNPVLYLLRTMSWVPITSNAKKTPEQISLTKTASKAFAGTFFSHSINPDSEFLQRVGGRRAIQALLVRIGAVSGLEDLPGEDLYRLLLDLPKRDPNGRNATSIYRHILESGGTDTRTPLHGEFLARGKMWGVQNGQGAYFPVSALRILAGRILPPAVKRLIPLLEVGSAHKIKEITRVFGVKAVGASEVTYQVDHNASRFREWTAALNSHVREVLPYLYALRLHRHSDASGREKAKLSEVQVHACESVSLDLTLNGTEKQTLTLTADDNGIVVGSGLYLTSDSSDFPEGDMAFWLGVGALFSDLLGVEVSANFATLLFCETPQSMLRVLNQHTERRGEELLKASKESLKFEPEVEDETIQLQSAVADVESTELAPVSPNSDTIETTGEAPVDVASNSTDVELVQIAAVAGESSTGADSQTAVDGELQNTSAPTGTNGAFATNGSNAESAESSTTLPSSTLQASNLPSASGGLSFSTTAAPTSVPRGVRQLVIVRAPKLSLGGISIASFADESVSLDVVKAFELKQGRFPIDVSHLHGSTTFGCDIVSVATDEIRLQALKSKSLDASRIVRYIEVKGRSSRRGTIELEPNQLTAAKKRRAKFFIYRVFHDQQNDGYFEVAVLSDPINSKAVIERKSVLFDLGSGSGAEWFCVQPDTTPFPNPQEGEQLEQKAIKESSQ